ncbi:aminotransferase class I/II-fold pyridoxal phosphate-dependent enzyme [Paenibacillus beijingensis]|uniref:Amino acid decarboxylase n=1 Tax=Paenibacillus beijingensis TaxID=1126833 RepID=A0A0D5NI02_9BACL|nr:aminotransferase class I/II-fold pyridoxal phosphate-dependent enzyme [Paenibacillus beijingensis]AJY74901.1 hypothetical protein VN24_10270 [Paenibacillus beijingensis]
MNTFVAPLLEALIFHQSRNPVSFHVPGHKYGTMLSDVNIGKRVPETDTPGATRLKSWFEQIMKLDVTELSTTDDLHHAEGVIKEAQQLAARCFGAEETHFLTGGSTAGNIALLMAACNPGDIIIVQRNVHKSVLNGLMLSGARAVFIGSQLDKESGQYTIPALDTVQEALRRYPEAKAVFLTNPNYYGMSTGLKKYAEAAHRQGALLLVDEAHGAHYGHHPELPQSALQAGADGVVQSTHKTLSAMTMGAMLHVQGHRLNRAALSNALSMIQSSSPSYPIMASLDIARAILDAFGEKWFEKGLNAASFLRNWLNRNDHPFILLEQSGSSAFDQLDPLRIVIRDMTGTLSGYELLKRLEEKGCWAEMADNRHVVLLIGAACGNDEAVRLTDALMDIASESGLRMVKENSCKSTASAFASTSAVFSTNAFASTKTVIEADITEPIAFERRSLTEAEVMTVAVEHAAGYRSAEQVTPYPPGIPLLYAGEPITEGKVKALRILSDSGAKCQGAADSSLRTIRVIKRETNK